MRQLTTSRLRRPQMAAANGFCMGVLAMIGAALSPAAQAQQCPTGQNVCSTQTPTGLVRTFPVPGTAGGIGSGVFMKTGFAYKLSAVGSIRVGVFGETGTPPDGWVPQGAAGPGFPAPDTFTFSLLYRVGSGGPWRPMGTGPWMAKLGPGDAPGSELMFGINDNKLSDNTGAFLATITEVAIGTKCCSAATSQPNPMIFGRSSSSTAASKPPSSAQNLPCAGKTPDGRRQSFQFPLYCSGNFSRNIPVEACTRAEALTEAQLLANSQPLNCHL